MLGACRCPNIRGDARHLLLLGTDLSSYEEGNTEFGGFLKRLLFDAGVSETVLKGPRARPQAGGSGSSGRRRGRASLSDKQQGRLDDLATGKTSTSP